MKLGDFKVKQKVKDRWYPDWGTGSVTKVRKTRVYVNFSIKGEMVFDLQHIQFLEPVR